MNISKRDKEYIKHINRFFDKKYFIEFFEITDESLIRQFINILTKKEKLIFIKELSYYSEIYSGISYEENFKALLNKYKKMKLYGRVFSKANYDDINDHIELRRLEYEYYEHYGNIIYEDIIENGINKNVC
jgi:hypothetical protein